MWFILVTGCYDTEKQILKALALALGFNLSEDYFYLSHRS